MILPCNQLLLARLRQTNKGLKRCRFRNGKTYLCSKKRPMVSHRTVPPRQGAYIGEKHMHDNLLDFNGNILIL